jgi:hypothetical protein
MAEGNRSMAIPLYGSQPLPKAMMSFSARSFAGVASRWEVDAIGDLRAVKRALRLIATKTDTLKLAAPGIRRRGRVRHA